jgi:nitrite reductase (NADH) large subunit
VTKRRLALVGAGMATCRLLDELLARDALARFDVSVFGEEPGGIYNRILLARVVAGEAPDAIRTKPLSWFEERGVTLHDGVAVTRLDTTRKLVLTADGAARRYDLAVVATGAQPQVPAIPGATVEGGALRPGVLVYRTMNDGLALREAARRGSSAIVLGGGLLGIEAAKALSDAGLHVTIVHAPQTLMNAQLDPLAGEMLARKIEMSGIFVRLGRTIETINGHADGGACPSPEEDAGASSDGGPVDNVTLDDGKTLPCDLVVLACGVRPRVDVARASGLPINRGIVVNDVLATEVPGVYALGDCAEHRGNSTGLVAPAWEQAAVLADVLTAAAPQARYRGSRLYTRLKVAGLDVATMGTLAAELETDDVIEIVEQRRSAYRKLVVRDGRLVSATLVGNTRAAATLVQLYDRGDLIPADPLEALCPQAVAPSIAPGDRTVCACNKVSEAAVRQSIDEGCDSIEAIAAATRAGTGCGSCKNELARLLARPGKKPTPLAAVG